MARTLRYLPHPGAVVEITQRTTQGRFLLKPSPRLNAIVAGCLARAQKNTGASVHAVAVLSGHFHLLASFETVEQMARFACHLKTNLSKEVGRIHDWPGPMFAGRYKSIPLSDEPEIYEKRLTYILKHGCKENLVMSPRDWPGVHCAEALADGKPIRGIWVDRTKLYAAKQRGDDVTEADFTTEEELHLAPLPSMADLPAEERRSKIRDIVEEIERESLDKHKRDQSTPLGAEAVCRRHPHERPSHLAKSNQPYFHATKRAFKALMESLREFVAAYRAAADRLAAGDRNATFPENCYPPGLPFVEPASIRLT